MTIELKLRKLQNENYTSKRTWNANIPLISFSVYNRKIMLGIHHNTTPISFNVYMRKIKDLSSGKKNLMIKTHVQCFNCSPFVFVSM